MLRSKTKLVGVSFFAISLATFFAWISDYGPGRLFAQTASSIAPSLKIVQRLSRPPNVTGLAWSPDGSKLATFSDYSSLITIWDASEWRIIREFHRYSGGYVGNNFAWLPSGILTGAAPKTRDDERFSLSLWNPETGLLVKNIIGPSDDQSLQHNLPAVFAASEDGSKVAMANYQVRHQVFVLDARTWSITASLTLPVADGKNDIPTALAFGVHDQLAVGSAGGQLDIFDLTRNTLERTIMAFPRMVARSVGAAAFSPTGEFLASAPAFFNTKQTLRSDPVQVWKANTGERAFALTSDGDGFPQIAWSPDGGLLSVISDGGVLGVWHIDERNTRLLTTSFGAGGYAASFSSRSILAVAEGQQVVILR